MRFTGDTRPGLTQACLPSEARYLVSITGTPMAIIFLSLEDETSVLTGSYQLDERFYCTTHTFSASNRGRSAARSRVVGSSTDVPSSNFILLPIRSAVCLFQRRVPEGEAMTSLGGFRIHC